MVAAVLFALMTRQLPSFSAEFVSTEDLPPLAKPLGFSRDGDLVFRDVSNNDDIYILHKGNFHRIVANGHGTSELSDDGEIQRRVQNSEGYIAIFRYRAKRWVQVSPIWAKRCDGYVQNAKGVAVANVSDTVGGKAYPLEIVDQKEIDLRPSMNVKSASAIGVTSDAYVLLRGVDTNDAKIFFWWKDGKQLDSIKVPEGAWGNQPIVTPTGEFFLENTEDLTATLYYKEGRLQRLKGQESSLYDVVYGHGDWYGGTERQGSRRKAVLALAGAPVFLDTLVPNRFEAASGQNVSYTAILAIGPSGQILATAQTPANEGSAKGMFLLTPTK